MVRENMGSSELRKKGIRVLGIAESFNKDLSKYSQIVGVVMRGDFLIDGFTLGKITVGGLDSTDVILDMIKKLNRDDIRVIFLSGCVIGWFNIIDIDKKSIKVYIVDILKQKQKKMIEFNHEKNRYINRFYD